MEVLLEEGQKPAGQSYLKARPSAWDGQARVAPTGHKQAAKTASATPDMLEVAD